MLRRPFIRLMLYKKIFPYERSMSTAYEQRGITTTVYRKPLRLVPLSAAYSQAPSQASHEVTASNRHHHDGHWRLGTAKLERHYPVSAAASVAGTLQTQQRQQKQPCCQLLNYCRHSSSVSGSNAYSIRKSRSGTTPPPQTAAIKGLMQSRTKRKRATRAAGGCDVHGEMQLAGSDGDKSCSGDSNNSADRRIYVSC